MRLLQLSLTSDIFIVGRTPKDGENFILILFLVAYLVFAFHGVSFGFYLRLWQLKSWFFFTGFIRNCINCVHNCEDHSSFDFHFRCDYYDYYLWFISYASITYTALCYASLPLESLFHFQNGGPVDQSADQCWHLASALWFDYDVNSASGCPHFHGLFLAYPISSNSSRPSINPFPRVIVPHWCKYLN